MGAHVRHMSGRASVGGSNGGVLHALLHRGVARLVVVLDSEYGTHGKHQMFDFLSFELIVHDSAGGWFSGLRG